MVKLCINCKHLMRSNTGEIQFAKCAHPTSVIKPVRLNLVTGEPLPMELPYAELERDEGGLCGPEGRKYEAS